MTKAGCLSSPEVSPETGLDARLLYGIGFERGCCGKSVDPGKARLNPYLALRDLICREMEECCQHLISV